MTTTYRPHFVDPTLAPLVIDYPDSDGEPMADNTLQFDWITLLVCELRALLHTETAFVGGNLLWYPIKGDNKTRSAPDVMVAIGRPAGTRSSYRTWNEGDISPQVVFEVSSPGNGYDEMMRRLAFFERFGVEEVYFYSPQDFALQAWHRVDGQLTPQPLKNLRSPRLGITFAFGEDGLQIYRPDGRAFSTGDKAVLRAEQEQERAEREQERAEREQERAQQEQERAERLAAQLRALGIEPEA
jgi:Uma2 family endonuclease